MLGSTVAGLANDLFGWRSGLAVAAAIALVAAGLAWFAIAAPARGDLAPTRVHLSIAALYGHVFENPKAIWLYAAVVAEGALIFGAFPFIGQLLIERTGSSIATAPSRTGFVLGAFAIGGLAYAVSVRRVIDLLGVRRMCIVGAAAAALSYSALVVFAAWWLDALAMLVAGLSYYMLHNTLQTEATEIAPAARGSAVALFACGLFAGQGIGPLVFGALVHAFGFPVALLGSSVGILLLGRLVVRRIIPTGDAAA
jgi:predicted MFS family arabinose efflux permease